MIPFIHKHIYVVDQHQRMINQLKNMFWVKKWECYHLHHAKKNTNTEILLLLWGQVHWFVMWKVKNLYTELMAQNWWLAEVSYEENRISYVHFRVKIYQPAHWPAKICITHKTYISFYSFIFILIMHFLSSTGNLIILQSEIIYSFKLYWNLSLLFQRWWQRKTGHRCSSSRGGVWRGSPSQRWWRPTKQWALTSMSCLSAPSSSRWTSSTTPNMAPLFITLLSCPCTEEPQP